jgi:Uma2 family endonuclease
MTFMTAGPGFHTAEELLGLPRGTWRYELVAGALRRMSPSGYRHGTVVARVGSRLGPFVEQHNLGETCGAETGFLLRRNPNTVRAPDAAFIRNETLAALAGPVEGFFPGAPDLAIEVRSPSDRDADLAGKIAGWLDAGSRAVLVIDPGRERAAVYRPGNRIASFLRDDAVELPDLLPGWSLILGEVFS